MSTPGSFVNEPVLELRRSSARAGLGDALARVDAALPVEIPDGGSGATLESTDPGNPERVVARTSDGD